jgi:hypothetical protein
MSKSKYFLLIVFHVIALNFELLFFFALILLALTFFSSIFIVSSFPGKWLVGFCSLINVHFLILNWNRRLAYWWCSLNSFSQILILLYFISTLRFISDRICSLLPISFYYVTEFCSFFSDLFLHHIYETQLILDLFLLFFNKLLFFANNARLCLLIKKFYDSELTEFKILELKRNLTFLFLYLLINFHILNSF